MIIDAKTQAYNNFNKDKPSFKKYLPYKVYQRAEKCTFAIEIVQRRTLNAGIKFLNEINKCLTKIINKFFGKNITDPLSVITQEKNFNEIKNNPITHMLAIYSLSRLFAGKKEVEINIENNELTDIVNDKQSCIFIMNHDKQREDSKLLCFFNALLSREYICNKKFKVCPKPKIILNKDILETTSKEKRKIGEILGAVGVDAGIYCADKNANTKTFLKLVKDFVANKTNIFIFPEGRMCTFRNLNPQWKFQTGVADLIKVALNKKSEVKVIPLGFAYKGKVGAINIGKPIYFKKEDKDIVFKPNEIDLNYQDKQYTNFLEKSFSKEGWYEISDNGIKYKIKK